MTIVLLKEVLLWCLIFNYAVLIIWFGIFVFAHDWLYRVHSRWFNLSAETFEAIHYAAMSFYKLVIFVFNLAPLLALWILAK